LKIISLIDFQCFPKHRKKVENIVLDVIFCERDKTKDT
jgi:hypothetical protein